jgi:hypothetical protein
MNDGTTKLEQVVARTWEDEAFKQELMSNPNAVLEREVGEKLPEGIELRVVQETSNTRYILIPSPSDITPEELEQMRQGMAGDYSSLTARSIEDEAFKQEFINNPNEVIERELGMQISLGFQVRVLDQDSNIRYFVLPQQPDTSENSELSDAELELIAGGGSRWWDKLIPKVTLTLEWPRR